jgi:LAS superfamily LD-carboxypeptidase LdcB
MAGQTANTGEPASALTPLELTGRARTHVRMVARFGCALHPLAADALLALRAAAGRAGIDLHPVSGFRDFWRQLAIWNDKYSGSRALLDARSNPLDVAALDPGQRVAAIMNWSALPGASRHHWGSDCDVIDRSTLEPGAPVELLDKDYAAGGRYQRLAEWLAEHAPDYGFYRPYDQDRGGVRPEPWHLSFAPVAGPALASLSPELLGEALAEADIGGREVVLARLPELHARYVAGVAAPGTAALAAAALAAAPLNPATRPA